MTELERWKPIFVCVLQKQSGSKLIHMYPASRPTRKPGTLTSLCQTSTEPAWWLPFWFCSDDREQFEGCGVGGCWLPGRNGNQLSQALTGLTTKGF